MKLITLLFIMMSLTSCGSMQKVSGKKYKTYEKEYTRKGSIVDEDGKRSFVGSEEHCFKDEDEREIITVPSHGFLAAVDHFYKRTVKIDIKTVSNPQFTTYHVKATENVNFELEIAECRISHLGGYFEINTPDNMYYYSSFRLAK